jgi:hypothetical protein
MFGIWRIIVAYLAKKPSGTDRTKDTFQDTTPEKILVVKKDLGRMKTRRTAEEFPLMSEICRVDCMFWIHVRRKEGKGEAEKETK